MKYKTVLALCCCTWAQMSLAAAPAIDAGITALMVMAADEPDGGEEDASPVQIARNDAGQVVLTVNDEVKQRIGLRVAQLESVERQPSVTAYGMLEDDPARTVTVRAPVNGYLRPSAEGGWPQVGATVHQGDIIGAIQPRFTAGESFDLLTRWTEASAEVEQLTAETAAARASFENKQNLNATGGLVSSRAVEDAEALLKGDEARLAAARKKAAMLEGLLAGTGDAVTNFALSIPQDGEVAEVAASLDESVDSGQALLRVTDPSYQIARVSLPIGTAVPAPDKPAQIVVTGDNAHVLLGKPMGFSAMRVLATRGPTLLYQVQTDEAASLRAGTPVVAHVPLSGDKVAGVLVPRSAIIRLGGLTWVYVQTAADTFERRSITLRAPEQTGWFADADPVSTVVVDGAQLLLSEEQKAQIESEEEASE
ncbi:MAG: efflux RND transporter periplasmic adaptor subunit [Phycisphaerales bacterium]|nr:efflux RND transporter periplasmic adaptor subunit [Phycisphaerales bacterium]